MLSIKSNTICLILAVKYGSLNDTDLAGTAHFLEHMLLAPYGYQYNIIKDISIKGTTIFNQTIYTILCKNSMKEFEIAIKILHDISIGYTLNITNLTKVRQDIICEYKSITSTQYYDMYYDLIRRSGISTDLPIGNLESIKQISYSDIVSSFNAGYVPDNMEFYIAGSKNQLRKVKDIFGAVGTMPNSVQVLDSSHNGNIGYVPDDSIELGRTSQEYYCVYFRADEFNNHLCSYIDLLDNLSLTLIEELIINQTPLTENDIATNIIQYSSNDKFYRFILRKDCVFCKSPLLLLKKISVGEKDINMIAEVIQSYRISIGSEDSNGLVFLKHMADCFILNQPIYDNNDLIKQLESISPMDVLKHSLYILNTNDKYQYCIRA